MVRPTPGLRVLSSSDGRDVYGLGTLVALLRVIGHLCALLERAIAFAIDPCVVDEQVLVAIVRGDEAEPLIVTEPLHCAGRHVISSTICACCYAEDASRASTCKRLHCFSPGFLAGQTARR